MSKKILLIDDDATSLKLMQVQLESEGYDISLARDGDVGLEKAQKDNPNLIILDIEMPRMNGYFFISELKKIESAKDIPIIVITSHDNMEQAFKSKGIKDYLVKPVDMEQLFEKIKVILI